MLKSVFFSFMATDIYDYFAKSSSGGQAAAKNMYTGNRFSCGNSDIPRISLENT